jgi:predicted DNA-binding transcriptional regulator YafY
MKPNTRQDAILRSLRRCGSSTVEALAAEVAASRRTILRDICALRDQGYVIHSDVGRGGGVYLDPHSVQTTPRLSVQEVFGLLISVAAMRAAWALPFSDFADAGLAKIERTLPADRIKDLRALLRCLHIGKVSPLQDISDIGAMDPQLLPTFETAFLHRQLMAFDYIDSKSNCSARRVEPQAMLILPPLWYLVAWDTTRQDFRHFRMDRISRAEAIAQTSYRRRHVPFADDVCPLDTIMG